MLVWSAKMYARILTLVIAVTVGFHALEVPEAVAVSEMDVVS